MTASTVPQRKELRQADILLRPFRDSDIDRFLEAIHESHVQLTQYMTWCHDNYTREETATFVCSRDHEWAEGRDFTFVIEDVENKVVLGTIGLNQINYGNRLANLGYWIRTSCTGRGIASRATQMVAKFGLEEVGLQRVEIVVAVDNVPSQRVAEKAGATYEGTLRNRILIHGRPFDAKMYSIIPSDKLPVLG